MNLLALALSVSCAIAADEPSVFRSPGGRVLHAAGAIAPPLVPDAEAAARLYARQNPSAFGLGARHGLAPAPCPPA